DQRGVPILRVNHSVLRTLYGEDAGGAGSERSTDLASEPFCASYSVTGQIW
ncbi:unnamed protein product, partial [Ilex paraguariensis]